MKIGKRTGYWKWGEQRALARVAVATDSQVSLVLNRQITPGWDLAKRLSRGAKTLGKDLPLQALLNNKTTDHPAFS